MTFIIDPITKQKFLLNSKEGKLILKKYINHYNFLKKQNNKIKIGGMNIQNEDEDDENSIGRPANEQFINSNWIETEIVSNKTIASAAGEAIGKLAVKINPTINNMQDAYDFLFNWSWDTCASLIYNVKELKNWKIPKTKVRVSKYKMFLSGKQKAFSEKKYIVDEVAPSLEQEISNEYDREYVGLSPLKIGKLTIGKKIQLVKFDTENENKQIIITYLNNLSKQYKNKKITTLAKKFLKNNPNDDIWMESDIAKTIIEYYHQSIIIPKNRLSSIEFYIIKLRRERSSRQLLETAGAQKQCNNAIQCSQLIISNWDEQLRSIQNDQSLKTIAQKKKKWLEYIKVLNNSGLYSSLDLSALFKKGNLGIKSNLQSIKNCTRRYIDNLNIEQGGNIQSQQLVQYMLTRMDNLSKFNSRKEWPICYLCNNLCNGKKYKNKNTNSKYKAAYPECEHIIPALRAIFFVGIFGNPEVMKEQLQINKLTSKYMTFLTLLYDWSHSACNGNLGKTDILFIKFDKENQKFIPDDKNGEILYWKLVDLYNNGLFKNKKGLENHFNGRFNTFENWWNYICQYYLNILLEFINENFQNNSNSNLITYAQYAMNQMQLYLKLEDLNNSIKYVGVLNQTPQYSNTNQYGGNQYYNVSKINNIENTLNLKMKIIKQHLLQNRIETEKIFNYTNNFDKQYGENNDSLLTLLFNYFSTNNLEFKQKCLIKFYSLANNIFELNYCDLINVLKKKEENGSTINFICDEIFDIIETIIREMDSPIILKQPKMIPLIYEIITCSICLLIYSLGSQSNNIYLLNRTQLRQQNYSYDTEYIDELINNLKILKEYEISELKTDTLIELRGIMEKMGPPQNQDHQYQENFAKIYNIIDEIWTRSMKGEEGRNTVFNDLMISFCVNYLTLIKENVSIDTYPCFNNEQEVKKNIDSLSASCFNSITEVLTGICTDVNCDDQAVESKLTEIRSYFYESLQELWKSISIS